MIDRTVAAVAGVLCLVLIAFLLIQTGKLHKAERRADKAELTLSQDREAAATANAQLVQKARETEQTLTRQAEQIKKETHAQITALDARAAALTRRLRDAAATSRLVPAAATVVSDGEAAAVCDGGGLSGKFGSHLISEAERGEKIRISLLACYKQYEDARKALSSLSP